MVATGSQPGAGGPPVPGPGLAVRLLEPGERGALAAYVERHPRATLYHHPRWVELTEAVFGHRCHWLGALGDGGALRGALPLVRLRSVLFGDFLVSLPFVNYGGALGDEEAIEEALIGEAGRLAGRLGCSHVELRESRERDTELPCRTDKVIMERELPDDPERLFKALGSKLRAQIRRPLREGATVHHGAGELLADFYPVFARNMRDLGTPVYSRRLFAAVLDAYPGQARLISVRLGGRAVAAGLLLEHRGRTEIPWASSLREHNRLGVNMLLYWEALKSSIERGSRVFDFGRSTRGGGTYRFKAQWGAEERPLYWYYWLREGGELPALTPSNPRYRAAIAVWRRLPVALTRLLGPPIVRNLP